MKTRNKEARNKVGSTVYSDLDQSSNDDNLTCKYFSESEFSYDLKNHKGLSFMHINIASLPKYFENLQRLTTCLHNLKIIGLSETRLNNNLDKTLNLEMQGYTFLNNQTTGRHKDLF